MLTTKLHLSQRNHVGFSDSEDRTPTDLSWKFKTAYEFHVFSHPQMGNSNQITQHTLLQLSQLTSNLHSCFHPWYRNQTFSTSVPTPQPNTPALLISPVLDTEQRGQGSSSESTVRSRRQCSTAPTARSHTRSLRSAGLCTTDPASRCEYHETRKKRRHML